MAPMYVRRWPRISASSRTPPSDIRTNSRLSARAIDSPIEVLPVPGGPMQRQDRARALVFGDAAVLAELAHGEVLDDAVLDVVEPGVVGVEHLARVDRVEALLASASPTAPRAASRGRCGSSRTRRVCVAHPLEARAARARPASRTSSGIPASSIFVRYSSATEASSSPSSLRIESICLRRKYSRCCFCAPSSTSSRMRRRTCSSASRSRWIVQRELQPLDDVDRLEQLERCVERHVGRVGARVGERARLADRAEELADAVVVLAQLEDLLDDGAVLASRARASGRPAAPRRAAPRPRRGAGPSGRCARRRDRRDAGRRA